MLLMACVPAHLLGQGLQLWADSAGRSLGLDLGRLWGYNLYEHSRFGLGAMATLPCGSADEGLLTLSAYGGYGLHDRHWKGGAMADLKLWPSAHLDCLWASFSHDYEAAGSRRIASIGLTSPTGIGQWMARRMSEATVLAAGGCRRWGDWQLALEGRIMSEGRLFDGQRLCYRHEGDWIEQQRGIEVVTTAQWGRQWASQLTLGGRWPSGKPVVRLLTQYSDHFSLAPLSLHLFAQAGLTPPRTPYTRLFDLGGVAGSFLYFDHALLTVSPSELTANAFCLVSLAVSSLSPLCEGWNPLLQAGYRWVPFVRLNGVWGWLWGASSHGRLTYEGVPLRAPVAGLAEAAAGIDGLLSYGVADWGLAVAYRLTPQDSDENLPPASLMLTARLRPSHPLARFLR